MGSIWQGGIWTVFTLVFRGGLLPFAYVLFYVCCVISAGFQFLLLSLVKGRAKWLYSALLFLLILAAEITSRFAYNYVQFFALLIIGFGGALLIGAVLATVIWRIGALLKRKA